MGPVKRIQKFLYAQPDWQESPRRVRIRQRLRILPPVFKPLRAWWSRRHDWWLFAEASPAFRGGPVERTEAISRSERIWPGLLDHPANTPRQVDPLSRSWLFDESGPRTSRTD